MLVKPKSNTLFWSTFLWLITSEVSFYSYFHQKIYFSFFITTIFIYFHYAYIHISYNILKDWKFIFNMRKWQQQQRWKKSLGKMGSGIAVSRSCFSTRLHTCCNIRQLINTYTADSVKKKDSAICIIPGPECLKNADMARWIPQMYRHNKG